MVQEALFGLPRWLVLGLGFGVAASLCAACLFYVGDRLFPSGRGRSTDWSGDARRVIEIREFLDAIGESYAENHPIDGQTVEFYLPERDVAITFDARAYYIIERSATNAVLVEHEMPGFHLGSRLPFETPEVEFGRDDPTRGMGGLDGGTDPVEGAFAVLGVPRTATEAQIRSAYRSKVKDVHPDHGGSQDEFRRVREAYTTAKDHAS
ncbi:MAG: DnaJ domain-containing protein [Haloarculaceae archaeon]